MRQEEVDLADAERRLQAEFEAQQQKRSTATGRPAVLAAGLEEVSDGKFRGKCNWCSKVGHKQGECKSKAAGQPPAKGSWAARRKAGAAKRQQQGDGGEDRHTVPRGLVAALASKPRAAAARLHAAANGSISKRSGLTDKNGLLICSRGDSSTTNSSDTSFSGSACSTSSTKSSKRQTERRMHFIADSGATVHIVDPTLLEFDVLTIATNVRASDAEIETANGPAHVSSIADLHFSMPDSLGEHAVLRDVYLVPGCEHVLYSAQS
jgi:hypothetical protein